MCPAFFCKAQHRAHLKLAVSTPLLRKYGI
jgi:hypothetical protein